MPRLSGGVWRSLLLGAAALLVYALYISLRLSYADYLARSSSPGALDAAIRMDPDNAAYLLRRGADGDAERAANRNNAGAAAWIELGLRAERAGNYALAERHLLAAAERDATYLPRWTLANFYFRLGRWEEFWHWAGAAARSYQGDLTSLYQLCLQVEPDPRVTLERTVGTRKDALRQYFKVILDAGANGEVVRELAERLSKGQVEAGDRELLVSAASRLVRRGEVTDGVAVWNAAARARLIPFQPLDVEAGRSLTNPDLEEAVSQALFNWQAPAVAGISMQRLTAAGGLLIRFNGRERSGATILRQYVPVLSGRRYRFRYVYRREERPTEAGCFWRVGEQVSGPLVSSRRAEESFEFRVGEGRGWITLELVVGASPGLTRPAGKLELMRTNLRLLDAI